MAGAIGKLPDGFRPRFASADAKSLSPHGRGGSVSRRDLNLLAGKRAQLAWALNAKRATKPIPSYSSGGGPGEALLLEKRPPPAFSPSPPLREGARGRGFSQRSRLPRITYITNHTAASWGGRLVVRRVGGASTPVQSSVAAQGASSREARGMETVRGSSERLKSAT